MTICRNEAGPRKQPVTMQLRHQQRCDIEALYIIHCLVYRIPARNCASTAVGGRWGTTHNSRGSPLVCTLLVPAVGRGTATTTTRGAPLTTTTLLAPPPPRHHHPAGTTTTPLAPQPPLRYPCTTTSEHARTPGPGIAAWALSPPPASPAYDLRQHARFIIYWYLLQLHA